MMSSAEEGLTNELLKHSSEQDTNAQAQDGSRGPAGAGASSNLNAAPVARMPVPLPPGGLTAKTAPAMPWVPAGVLPGADPSTMTDHQRELKAQGRYDSYIHHLSKACPVTERLDDLLVETIVEYRMQDAGWMPSKPRDPPDDGEYTIVDTAVRKYHKEWEKDKQIKEPKFERMFHEACATYLVHFNHQSHYKVLTGKAGKKAAQKVEGTSGSCPTGPTGSTSTQEGGANPVGVGKGDADVTPGSSAAQLELDQLRAIVDAECAAVTAERAAFETEKIAMARLQADLQRQQETITSDRAALTREQQQLQEQRDTVAAQQQQLQEQNDRLVAQQLQLEEQQRMVAAQQLQLDIARTAFEIDRQRLQPRPEGQPADNIDAVVDAVLLSLQNPEANVVPGPGGGAFMDAFKLAVGMDGLPSGSVADAARAAAALALDRLPTKLLSELSDVLQGFVARYRVLELSTAEYQVDGLFTVKPFLEALQARLNALAGVNPAVHAAIEVGLRTYFAPGVAAEQGVEAPNEPPADPMVIGSPAAPANPDESPTVSLGDLMTPPSQGGEPHTHVGPQNDNWLLRRGRLNMLLGVACLRGSVSGSSAGTPSLNTTPNTSAGAVAGAAEGAAAGADAAAAQQGAEPV